jgi:tRNA splicing endonuclease
MNQQGVTAPQNHPLQSIKMITNANPEEYRPTEPTNVTPEVKQERAATQPIDPQIARIAKERRALQIRQKELLVREQALANAPKEGMIELSRLKSDPLNVLLENGVTYDQLAQAVMSNQQNNEVHKLKAEIEALRQGVDQKFVEKDALAERQVLAEMRREADHLSRSDAFELVRETRSVPTVVKLIERTWRERKEVLDVPEAMKLVEDELFKDAQRVAKVKKMQSLYPQAALQTQQRQPQGMRTLTNRDTASVPMGRKARALAAYYGTYKR